jgi:hypothetical protein
MQDLTGQKYNRLTITSFSHIKDRNYYWNCKCACGNESVVNANALKRGTTKSCGCWHKELGPVRRFTHGQTDTRLYQIHENIKQRCTNPKNDSFKYYGERGIKICEEWLQFETFYEWAQINGYEESLTIDRIDNNGDYSPDNCRWVTQKEQVRNTCRNILLTLGDKTQCTMDWSIELNINYETLRARKNNGWSDEKTLTTPVQKYQRTQI